MYNINLSGFAPEVPDFEGESKLQDALTAARFIKKNWPRSKPLLKHVTIMLHEYETTMGGHINTRDYLGATHKYIFLGVPDAVIELIKGQLELHHRGGRDQYGNMIPLNTETIR